MCYTVKKVGETMYQFLGNTGIRMYDILSFLSFVPVLIFNFSQFKKKKNLLSRKAQAYIEKKKTPDRRRLEKSTVLWEILLISAVQYFFAFIINTAFGEIVNTGPNYYGLLFITPVILAVAFILSGIDVLKQMDLITPAFPLALIPIKFACFCHGCCSGIECSFGFYNHFRGVVDFPVQLVEVGEAILIFVILMMLRNKAKEGTLFPLYLILYSSMRFFSEFLRYEENVIWILKKYHLLCLAGIVVGTIELLLVTKYKDKLILNMDTLKKRLNEYAVKNGIVKDKNIVHHKKRKKKR